MKLSPGSHRAHGASSCSTLKRVVPNETENVSTWYLAPLTLAVPSIGSYLMKLSKFAKVEPHGILGVPSIGSYLMKLITSQAVQLEYHPCSTLNRVVPNET